MLKSLRFLSNHIKYVMQVFDPIHRLHSNTLQIFPVPVQESKKIITHKHFLLPCMVIIWITCDYIFHYLCPDFDYQTNNDTFFRIATRIWPASVSQRDALSGMIYLPVLFYYFCLLFNPMKHFNFVMFLVGPEDNLKIFCQGICKFVQFFSYLHIF